MTILNPNWKLKKYVKIILLKEDKDEFSCIHVGSVTETVIPWLFKFIYRVCI